MSETPPKPELVIDSDWKEQVAKEKAAAQRATSNAPVADDLPEETDHPTQSLDAPSNMSGEKPDRDDLDRGDLDRDDLDRDDLDRGELPPPGMSFLVSMLFTQAMAFLGQIPDPGNGQTRVDKPMAKHTIDTLDILSAKTKGNLSVQEAKMFNEALHVLRMAYVNCRG